MTGSDSQNESPAPPRRSSNRKAKLVLLAAILVLCGVFYMMDIREPPMPEGFTTNLEAARKLARDEIRHMLILFWSPKVDKTATAHLLGEKGLRHKPVVEAIKRGRYVCVAVKLDQKLDSDLAKEFKITRVPTLMVLSSMGLERQRIEGSTGHAAIQAMLVKWATSRP